MPGYNVEAPGLAFTNAMEESLMAREAVKQKAFENQLRLQQEQRLAKSSEALDAYHRSLVEEKTDELKAKKEAKEHDEAVKERESMPPGTIPSSEQLARFKKFHIPAETSPGGAVQIPPSQPVQLPGAPAAPGAAQMPGTVVSPVPGMNVPPTPAGPVLGQPGGPQALRIQGGLSPTMGQEKFVQQEQGRRMLEEYIKTLPEGAEKKALMYELMTGKNAPSMMREGAGARTPQLGTFGDYLNRLSGGHPENISPADIEAARKKWAAEQRNPLTDALAAVRLVEQKNVAAATDPKNWDQTTVDMIAKAMAEGDAQAVNSLVGSAGLAGLTLPVRKMIIDRSTQYDTKTHAFRGPGQQGPAPDVASQSAAYKAASKTITDQTTLKANVDAFSRTADDISKLFDKTLAKIPDSGVTWLNKPLRTAATAFGSESMAEYNTFRLTLQNEYSRLTTNPKLTGVLSDTARKEMENILAPDATVAQIRTSLAALKKESATRSKNIGDEITTQRKSIGGQDQERIRIKLEDGRTGTWPKGKALPKGATEVQ